MPVRNLALKGDLFLIPFDPLLSVNCEKVVQILKDSKLFLVTPHWLDQQAIRELVQMSSWHWPKLWHQNEALFKLRTLRIVPSIASSRKGLECDLFLVKFRENHQQQYQIQKFVCVMVLSCLIEQYLIIVSLLLNKLLDFVFFNLKFLVLQNQPLEERVVVLNLEFYFVDLIYD